MFWAFAVLLVLCGAAFAAGVEGDLAGMNGQFRVGMECAYAPSNWQETSATENNVPVENVPGAYAEGYDVQFARIIAEKLGLRLVIVKLDWDGLIPALNQGQIDAIIAGMSDTEERRQAINFSSAYHRETYGIIDNKDSKFAGAKDIQDFSGASLQGQKDTVFDTVIDQIEGVDHLPAAATVPDMVARLQQGACDGIVVNVEGTRHYLKTNPSFALVTFDEGHGFATTTPNICVGLRKADEALLTWGTEAVDGVDQQTRDAMWDAAVEAQPR